MEDIRHFSRADPSHQIGQTQHVPLAISSSRVATRKGDFSPIIRSSGVVLLYEMLKVKMEMLKVKTEVLKVDFTNYADNPIYRHHHPSPYQRCFALSYLERLSRT